MSWAWPEGIRNLQGGGIRLEPLSLDHVAGLTEAAATATDHEWDMGFVPRPDDMKVYVSRAIYDLRAGRSFPFAVCLETGEPIGTSWFRVFDPWRRKLEIGFTWYAAPHRKGIANLQTKLLLMSFAFDVLNCILVEFLVYEGNLPSRRAIAGLGARQDGMLRRVIPMGDGTFGDVVVFSVSNDEWPAVKSTMASRLESRRRVPLDGFRAAGPTGS
ncbi:GNAT family N-acetyltransferase [Nitrospirillum viridazoti]|uniref:RimJ/RimL family protein N-acetyltransferase n=1 Tax=Nitrospirillum amazonense TaxID=28077 RepID=A0A560IZB3_9PROT|nr:GNAT family N-acetyltransferase [Nitrospirillum amazonense]TWB64362.1 RimJ/RimL family protein N-acetyltransferase [Nitrospirillum amazonense]